MSSPAEAATEREQIDRQRAEIQVEAAALDPATAELIGRYEKFGSDDDYNLIWMHYARAPGGDWISFDDLPEKTREALEALPKEELEKRCPPLDEEAIPF